MAITKIRIDQWITSDGTPYLCHAKAETHERRWLLEQAIMLSDADIDSADVQRIIDVLTSRDAPFIILTKREGK